MITIVGLSLKKDIYGKKALIFLFDSIQSAVDMANRLKTGKYYFKAGLTIRRTYKVGLFIDQDCYAFETTQSDSKDPSLKWLVEGSIKAIGVGYYREDSTTFVYTDRYQIHSGSMN